MNDNSRRARLIKMHEDIKVQKNEALAMNDYETLASLRDMEKKIASEITEEDLKISMKK